VGREEGDRRVAPVVSLSWWAVLGVKLKNRQQFHRGDAEVLKVRDFLNESRICSPRLFTHAGTRMAREATQVHFVDDGAGGG